MTSFATLLLTIALALYPLSGGRAMATGAPHAQAVAAQAKAAVQGADAHVRHGGGDHRESSAVNADAAAVHVHASPEDHGLQHAAESPCSGDHGSSSCCSVSCHAMAPLAGAAVPAQRHVVMLIGVATLPMPHGVGFDGLLRPPRPA
ncbi:hypothetical protein GCM10007036_22290 [Alsobacter metallidurans]|uniref:CopL family metal-binding regulatory protein n=1 Tax=Alsobacter metallidurans TaxID=340221 RepID=A0A917I751_9HYPH|nr:hypothetical protein [Alsobacter metallidurans]GGH19406.1 hypothetical protein GCM10007036_22290 [Alsobacter metallidurans]